MSASNRRKGLSASRDSAAHRRYNHNRNVRGACLIAVIAISQVAGQRGSVYLKPPFGIQNQLVSPDGAFALFGGDNALWLEDERT
jgi:predicted RNA methylase